MISIGAFSKICQVSVKTLRHYDQIGLVAPKFTDEATGYRYYGEEQLETMQLIRRYKRYGMALREILPLLECRDKEALLSKLREQQKILVRQQEETAEILRELGGYLEYFERTGDRMGVQRQYEISLAETEDTAVIAVRRMMGVREFDRYYGELFRRAKEARIPLTGKTGAVYHDKEFNHESSDIELVLETADQSAADRVVKGGPCARTIHRGDYGTLSDAYAALVKWIHGQGLTMAGSPHEFYLKSHIDGLEPEDWETEIFFPVSGEGVV